MADLDDNEDRGNNGGGDIFTNNHDLIGVEGIIRSQKNEIEKKKLELRMENEKYFRQHPEIRGLMTLFVRKILDDRPDNILEYAGTFFDRAELRDVVEQAIEQERREAERNELLNNLIKGKTLIQ
eukprot:403348804